MGGAQGELSVVSWQQTEQSESGVGESPLGCEETRGDAVVFRWAVP